MIKSIIIGIFSVLLAISGVYFLIKAPEIGSNAADKYVEHSGGDVDTDTYLVILQGYEYSYVILGAIFLFMGLLTLISITLIQINKNK